MNRTALAGLGFALAAYVIWGGFPLYWKLLAHVTPLEVLAHRVLWTLPFAAVMVQLGREWAPVRQALTTPAQLALLALTATLIALNWGLYIWSVTNARVVEASLGYYLTPIVSVLLGVLAFGERPRALQWAAIALAAAGVTVLLVIGGVVPWVSLTLAFSFAAYGALRKLAPMDSAAGLLVETLILVPFALGWLLWLGAGGTGAFGRGGLADDLLLVGAGIVTAVPLLCYVAGARRLPLATVGVLFYINPTLQFLLGTLLYDEPLSAPRLYAFLLIWIGVLCYIAEGVLRSRQMRRQGVRAALDGSRRP